MYFGTGARLKAVSSQEASVEVKESASAVSRLWAAKAGRAQIIW